jgi:hypothetical protein
LSYLTPGRGWQADYVARYNESDSKIDVPGWVTLTNSSGATYDNAQVLLVAGSTAQADGGRVVRANHAMGDKNGRPLFRLALPANDAVTLRDQTQHPNG